MPSRLASSARPRRSRLTGGREHDPADPWGNHVVCVYTRDWRDQDDVLRVARRLHEVWRAVKKMKLTYKPDVLTHDGRYEGNAPGDIAIYTCSAPYDHLAVNHEKRVTGGAGVVSAQR
jgi:hypothetical protein